MPERASEDSRKVSSHGKRLLNVLGDRGIISNGLITKQFSGTYTRLPQGTADCPGVLDYVCGPISMLRQLRDKTLCVRDAVPDFSDHCPVAVDLEMDAPAPTPQPSHDNFITARMKSLKLPQDDQTWEQIEVDIGSSTELRDICDTMRQHLSMPCPDRATTQDIVDSCTDRLVNLIQSTFQSYGLAQNRTFGHSPNSILNSRISAPPELRKLRQKARHAYARLQRLRAMLASEIEIKTAKSEWNHLGAQCRKLSHRIRTGFHDDWRKAWRTLRRCAPRELWRTYRSFTRQVSVEPLSTPDQQWQHWASQGDISEPVWKHDEKEQADAFVDELRQLDTNTLSMPAPTESEVSEARKRLKPGRSPGVDGIPSDVLRRLDCLLEPVTLLFSTMIRSAVYSRTLGIALIRSLVKPGKPPEDVTSLRGASVYYVPWQPGSARSLISVQERLGRRVLNSSASRKKLVVWRLSWSYWRSF